MSTPSIPPGVTRSEAPLLHAIKVDEGGDLGLEFNLAEVAGLRSEAKMTLNYCAAAQW
ncbi:hypothetical protein [Couchioplanes caeruleus]|uniref:hypothetical protein n=1 Tax=Couchioplanes caeruleus TaxID=56438 RepID=UPI000ABEBF28|nr:hypothetical protein [Couchioplanes caeruleus]